MRKRFSQDPPACAPFVSACGRVSGTCTPTMLACLAPPHVRTTARLMHAHRLGTWAAHVRKLSPAGGAKSGSTWARVRGCLEQWPACKALITRFRDDAARLLAGQQMRNTTGLSHDTRARCEPLMDPMPSSTWRQECRAALAFARETAAPLGLEHIGVPISAEAIASLCGVAKRHGGGETAAAHRLARRLPTWCGVPTREEAAQGRKVRMASPQARTAQCPSWTRQRREVLGHPERLARLRLEQAHPHVARIPRPQNRSNSQEIIHLSNGDEECDGPPLRSPRGPSLLP